MADEMIPVEGVRDWVKDRIKGVLLNYAKPYWEDIKTAIAARDFGKLADLVDKIGAMAGYVEIAKTVSDFLRSVQGGSWADVIRKGADLFEIIAGLFKSLPAPPSPVVNGGITVSATAKDGTDTEIDECVEYVFAKCSPPTVGAVNPPHGVPPIPLGPDGKPVDFGIIEIGAILSILWTAWQFFQNRRKQKAG